MIDSFKILKLETEYNKKNIECYNLSNLGNFKDSLNTYKEVLKIAKELNNELYELETCVNMGYCLYQSGKLNEAIDVLMSGVRISSITKTSVFSKNINNLNSFIQYSIKCYCNLIIVNLAVNNLDSAKIYIEKIILFTNQIFNIENTNLFQDNNSDKLLNKVKTIYLINTTLFGNESLIKYSEQLEDLNKDNFKKVENNNDQVNENANYKHLQRIIHSFYYLLFKLSNLFNTKADINLIVDNNEDLLKSDILEQMFLSNKDMALIELNNWINILKEEIYNFKSEKNLPGFVFSVFNYTIGSIIIKEDKNKHININSNNNTNSLKNKLLALSKLLTSSSTFDSNIINSNNIDTNIEENVSSKINYLDKDIDINNIIFMFLKKLLFGVYVYSKLTYFEEETMQLINRNNITTSNYDKDNNLNQIRKLQLISLYANLYLKQLNTEVEELSSAKESNSSDDYIENQINEKNDLIFQLQFVLLAISTNTIDLTDLDLDIIDPNIFKAFKLLYNNLCNIRYKNIVKNFFKKFMFNTLGYSNRKALTEYKSKKFRIFISNQLNYLRDGTDLTKFNYSSKGTKIHFYQISIDDNCLKIYEKKNSKSFTKIYFNEIVKFSYGICSSNLRKKFKKYSSNYNYVNNSSTSNKERSKSKDKSTDKKDKSNNKDNSFDISNNEKLSNDVATNISERNLKPWECFSIYTNKRSLDFAGSEEIVNRWFYGIKCLFNQIKLNTNENESHKYKHICSVSYYRLFKIKMKLFEVLRKEYYDRLLPNKEMFEKEIELINKALKNAFEYGPNYISFSKIFLFTIKIKPDILINKGKEKSYIINNNISNISNININK